MRQNNHQKEDENKNKDQISKNDILACFLIFIGCVSFVLSYIYSNQNDFSFCQTVLVWGIGNLCITSLTIKLKGQSFIIDNTEQIKRCTFRNFCLTINGAVIALVQFYLPLPIIYLIDNTGPFFVFIIDYLINGTHINKNQVISLIIGLIGLLLIVNQKIIEKYFDPEFQFKSLFQNYHSQSSISFIAMILLQTFSVIVWAYGVVLTKELKSKAYQITFNHGILLVISMGLSYQFELSQPKQIQTSKYIISIFATGFLLALTSFCYVNGLKLTKKSGMITTVGFISVPLGYLISVFRYNEPINHICLIRGALVIIGVLSLVKNS